VPESIDASEEAGAADSILQPARITMKSSMGCQVAPSLHSLLKEQGVVWLPQAIRAWGSCDLASLEPS
jgi:hypothetical protein